MRYLTTTMSKIKQSICAKLFLVGTIFVFTSFAFPTHAQVSDWYIESFDSVVAINEDSTITVSETIDVYFDSEKHGIYRKIPTVYRDKINNRIKTELEILHVIQDGSPATLNIYREGANQVIRIGDADRVLTGKHSYEIIYNVDRALLFFDDFDELYWNVTGVDWEVPITKVSATVRLPDWDASIISTSCYTGAYGSTNNNCEISNSGYYSNFKAGDFLTIAASFPKGIVKAPTSKEKMIWFLLDNWSSFIPIGLILLVIILWFKMGRDPKMNKSIIPEYDPPIGMKAVYAGVLVYSRVTKQYIASMIIQLAVDGYLKIKVDGEKKSKQVITLEKLKNEDGLDPAHRKLFVTLFGSKQSVTLDDIKKSVSKSGIGNIKNELHKKLQKEKYFTHSSFWMRTLMLVVGAIQVYSSVFLGFMFGSFTGALMMLGGFVTIMFGFLMPKKTLQGIEVTRRVLGFKMFMHTAERYRSEWQERQHIFFEFLPFAIAFNDTKHWAKVFEGLDLKAPNWYQTSLPVMNLMSLTDSISNVSHSVASATIPKAASGSGSSGGGFSGGGMGGGGGGSW